MLHRVLAVTVVVSLASTPVVAQTDVKHQSRARPFGLSIADTVKIGGSDARSVEFQKNVLPSLKSLVSGTLSERKSIANTSAIALDPSQLKLATDTSVRVYFVGEGAGYHNTLGFNTGGTPKENGQLIFPDASSKLSYLSYLNARNGTRSYSMPVLPGDFVDVGTFEAGTQLDFFVIANGARGGRHTYSTRTELNPDGIDHVVALAVPDSPYLVIGFEDLYGGGDRDFNDVVFTVDVGRQTVRKLSGAPEPGTSALLLAVGGVGTAFWLRSRRQRGRSAAVG